LKYRGTVHKGATVGIEQPLHHNAYKTHQSVTCIPSETPKIHFKLKDERTITTIKRLYIINQFSTYAEPTKEARRANFMVILGGDEITW
jgi:hypothetical protein